VQAGFPSWRNAIESKQGIEMHGLSVRRLRLYHEGLPMTSGLLGTGRAPRFGSANLPEDVELSLPAFTLLGGLHRRRKLYCPRPKI